MLTRKTPLKRKTPWHPRRKKLTNSAPIKAIATKTAAKQREYAKAKTEFARAMSAQRKAYCESCGTTRNLTLHHRRGRAGSLISDMRFFSLLCFSCHEWVHAHPKQARERGLLAPSSEWNVVPRE